MSRSKAPASTFSLSRINVVLLVAGFAYGLYRTIDLAWVCDDAFITFRYAKNFVDGHGLVFNIGERVEGYTSFLWTMIISVGQMLSLEIIRFSQVMSIAAYVATALLLMLFSFRFYQQQRNKSLLIVPVAALAILVMRDYHVWATSGMETSLAALLLTLGVYALVFAKNRWQFTVAGVVMVLAVMTRPEALLCLGMGGIFILLAERPGWRPLLHYVVPAVVIYLPYWIIRYNYFGYPFPNTYYAKSGNLAYWSQGWTYLWLFLKTYYVLFLLIPAAALLVARVWRNYREHSSVSDVVSRSGLASLLICVPLILYVVRVGGDFMFARFFIPVIPLCFLVVESALVSVRTSAVVRTAIGLIIVLSTLASISQFAVPMRGVEGIVDEPTYYPDRVLAGAKTDGELLKRVFAEIDSVPVAFYGMKAMLMYYSELPIAIEAHAGLTDEYLAHMPIVARGRPGHEKQAPYEYLRRRRVLFSFPSPGRMPEISRIWFGNQEAAIIHYDNRVMEHLKRFPEVRFVDFPAYLDRFIQESYNRPDSLVLRELAFFKQFYFDFNDDPLRFEQIRQRLGG